MVFILSKQKLILGIFLWLLIIAFIVVVPQLPLVSNQPIEAPFLHVDGSDKAIVFFGFSECSDTCPVTLTLLSKLLSNAAQDTELPLVIFVDIDQQSSEKQASLYAKGFHTSFVGYHPNILELEKLSIDFGLNFRRSNSQILHQGRTYLLKKYGENWRLIKSLNSNTFSTDTLKTELSL